MELKKALKRLSASPVELDQERLREFCCAVPDTTRIADAEPRQEIRVVGEITSVRIVPRPQGSPWLEATVSDGTGWLVAMWTGRTNIGGVKPGRRLVVCGRAAPIGPGRRLLIYNPRYELLA